MRLMHTLPVEVLDIAELITATQIGEGPRAASGNAIDIDRLFVAPGSFRNGRALVASLNRRRDATVGTACDNRPAKRLYESLGFVRTHDEEDDAGLTIAHLKREA